jgi:Late competence development protein ComFB
MSKTTVHLTISLVETEAETVLHRYPYYPYQQAFSAPSLRQRLVAYVLSRLPSLYSVVEEQEALMQESLHCPPEQRSQVETLIHRGIQYLLSGSVRQVVPESTETYEDLEEMNVGFPSSHWFK